MQFLTNLWDLFVDMSFYIVIGILFTGVLHAFVKKDVIFKHIGKKDSSSVVKAAILGVPLPLCSCGVVPTAMYLGKSGASKGAVVSFLTSTPQTGVDSIIATYGLMGPVFAAYRAVAAFLSGIFAGIMTEIFCKNDDIKFDTAKTTSCCCSSEEKEKPIEKTCCCGSHKEEKPVEKTSCCCSSHEQEKPAEKTCCCGSQKEEKVVEKTSCCCSSHEQEKPVEKTSCCCSTKKEEKVVVASCCSSQKQEVKEEHSCCCSSTDSEEKELSFIEKVKSIFTYGFGSFLDEIALNFVVGLIVAALISTVIPEELLHSFTNPIISMLLMLVIGIPMYVCSTASIPIAVSLIMKGITPGAAFVFLFAGPVTNIASLTILNKTLGKKVMAIYLGSVAVCSVAFGLILDYVLNIFAVDGVNNVMAHVHSHSTPMYMIVVAIIFGLLVVRSLFKQYLAKK